MVCVTVCLRARGARLLVERIGDLRAAVRETLLERPVEVLAWVVMPDHWHAVWQLPEGDRGYSSRVGAIKGRFSRRVQFIAPSAGGSGSAPPDNGPRVVAGYGALKCTLRPGVRGIWQRRFYERHARGEANMRAMTRHVHLNPVKHGYVARAEDWPFSTVHREIRAGRWDP